MNDKMGRNPFAAKTVSGKEEKPKTVKMEQAAPEQRHADAQAAPRKKRKTPSAKASANSPKHKPSPVAALASLRNWKLERLSFLRIDGDSGAKPQVTLLDLRLKNAQWKGSREFALPILKNRWMTVRAVWARIQSV